MPVIPGNIPALLRDTPNWVCWRYLERGGRWTKAPFRPDGRLASSTDRSTWSSFDDVVDAYGQGGFDGIGIALDGRPVGYTGLVIAGVDIDKVDLDAGRQARAREIIRAFKPSYTETSPGGQGVRIFCLARPLAKGVSREGVELYTTGRYLTVTGHIHGGLDA